MNDFIEVHVVDDSGRVLIRASDIVAVDEGERSDNVRVETTDREYYVSDSYDEVKDMLREAE